MRTVRVLQVVLSLNPGGAERLVCQLVRHLPSPPFETLVCCLDEAGSWASPLKEAGVRVFAFNRQPGFRPFLGARIAALARRVGADVLHCHEYTPFVYGCIAKLLHPRLRIVFTAHGRLADGPPSPKRQWVNPLLGRVPARRFAVCENLRQFLVREGFPAAGLEVLYNGIDVEAYRSRASRAESRQRIALPEESFVIGTVARLYPVKDLATLLRGFSEYRRDAPAAGLVVVGDGPERSALEALGERLGAAGAIRFLGTRSDVPSLLPAFDLYANTSVYEGTSLTLLEAIAAGLPVLATAVGGTPEIVEHGTTGWLVPARDPASVAAALRTLGSDPALRSRLVAAASRRLEERFTFERMIDRYVRAYLGEEH